MTPDRADTPLRPVNRDTLSDFGLPIRPLKFLLVVDRATSPFRARLHARQGRARSRTFITTAPACHERANYPIVKAPSSSMRSRKQGRYPCAFLVRPFLLQNFAAEQIVRSAVCARGQLH